MWAFFSPTASLPAIPQLCHGSPKQHSAIKWGYPHCLPTPLSDWPSGWICESIWLNYAKRAIATWVTDASCQTKPKEYYGRIEAHEMLIKCGQQSVLQRTSYIDIDRNFRWNPKLLKLAKTAVWPRTGSNNYLPQLSTYLEKIWCEAILASGLRPECQKPPNGLGPWLLPTNAGSWSILPCGHPTGETNPVCRSEVPWDGAKYDGKKGTIILEEKLIVGNLPLDNSSDIARKPAA